MDTSRGFLSGTVDRFKMVRIYIHIWKSVAPLTFLLSSTRTSLDRFSRQNQVEEWPPWWRPSSLSSCSYTTWPNRCIAWSFISVAQSCCLHRTHVYHYFARSLTWTLVHLLESSIIVRSAARVTHSLSRHTWGCAESLELEGVMIYDGLVGAAPLAPNSLYPCSIRILCALFLLGNSMHGIRLIWQGEMLSVLDRCCLLPLRRKWDAKCQNGRGVLLRRVYGDGDSTSKGNCVCG